MRFTGLNASQLLRDPSQQLAFGYVSGNPLVWVDLFGLAEFLYGSSTSFVDGYVNGYEVNVTSETWAQAAQTLGDASFVAILFRQPVLAAKLSTFATTAGVISASMTEEPTANVIKEGVAIAFGGALGKFSMTLKMSQLEPKEYVDYALDVTESTINRYFGTIITSTSTSNNQPCEKN